MYSKFFKCLVLALMFSFSAYAGKKDFHCEVKKNGKHVDLSSDEAPDRKSCKKQGGKWVKEHPGHKHDGKNGHDHGHDHDEE